MLILNNPSIFSDLDSFLGKGDDHNRDIAGMRHRVWQALDIGFYPPLSLSKDQQDFQLGPEGQSGACIALGPSLLKKACYSS